MAEGWNQTEKDWEFMVRQPQNICLAATVGEKIIGTSLAINYNNDVAWIGMVLVDKNHRGKGVSKLLLEILFQKLNHCKSIKLDATPAGQKVYQKFGFENEYVIHRMVRPSSTLEIPKINNSNTLSPTQSSDISSIIQYDSYVFGAERSSLVKFLSSNFLNKSWILRQGHQIKGFALGRVGSRFHQIGPVSASSTEIAKTLISTSIQNIGRKDSVIDVLDDKKELIDWLESMGFEKRRHFIRMYKNSNPFPGTIKNQFLICGPEFG